MDKKSDMEDILGELKFGRWHMIFIILSLATRFIEPVHKTGTNLFSFPPKFRCSQLGIRDLTEYDTSSGNQSHADGKTEFPSVCLEPKDSSNQEGPNFTISKNSMDEHLTGLPSCPVVQYDTSVFESSIVTDWHLICEKASLRPLFQIMHVIGSVFGSVIGGFLSDRYGRKKAIQIAILLTVPTTVGIFLAPWFSVLLLMRVLSATGIIILYYSVFTLVAETMPPRRRAILLVLMDIADFLSISVVGALGYVFHEWRVLWAVCNSPFVIVLVIYCVIDESPRWLLSQGRGEEAADILQKAAKQNGVEFSPKASQILDSIRRSSGRRNADRENSSAWHYVSTPGMRSILLVTPLLWICQRTLYQGMILSANIFTGKSPFEYIILIGLVATVSVLLISPIVSKLKRRTFVGLCLAGGAICVTSDLAVPTVYSWLRWVLVAGAFGFTSGAYQVNFVYAAELLPTVIRNRGLTFFCLVGSVGDAIAPLVTDIVAPRAWWASNTCFGAAGVIGSLLVTLLPETKDLPLPETVEDVEERRKGIWTGREDEDVEMRQKEAANEGEERMDVVKKEVNVLEDEMGVEQNAEEMQQKKVTEEEK